MAEEKKAVGGKPAPTKSTGPSKPPEKKEGVKIQSFLDIFKKKCSSCGSTNIVKDESETGIYYECKKCGHYWTEQKKAKKKPEKEEEGEEGGEEEEEGKGKSKKEGKKGEGTLSKLTKKQKEVTGFLATSIGRIFSGIVYLAILGFMSFNFLFNYILKIPGIEKLIQTNMMIFYPIAPGIVTNAPLILSVFLGLAVVAAAAAMTKGSFTKNILLLIIVGTVLWAVPAAASVDWAGIVGGTAGEGLASLMCMITSPEDMEGCMKEKGFGLQVTKVGEYEVVVVNFGSRATDYKLPSAVADKEFIFPYFFVVSVENPDKEKTVENLALSAYIKNGTDDYIVVGNKMIKRLDPDLCNATKPCNLPPGEKTTATFETSENFIKEFEEVEVINPDDKNIADKKSKSLKVYLTAAYKFSGEGKNTFMIYEQPVVEKSYFEATSMSGPLDIAVYFVPEVYIMELYQASRNYVDVYVTLMKEKYKYSAISDSIKMEKLFITKLAEGSLTSEGSCTGPFGTRSIKTISDQTDEIILEDKDMRSITKDRTYRCKYMISGGVVNYKTVPFSVVANYTHEKTIEGDVKVDRMTET